MSSCQLRFFREAEELEKTQVKSEVNRSLLASTLCSSLATVDYIIDENVSHNELFHKENLNKNIQQTLRTLESVAEISTSSNNDNESLPVVDESGIGIYGKSMRNCTSVEEKEDEGDSSSDDESVDVTEE